MRHVYILLFFLLLFESIVSAQPLKEYINEGLNNNIELKEKVVNFDKALIALKEAKSLFLPTIYFETQYTLAKGGRSIDIPVGDLLNPIYKRLNQITGRDDFSPTRNVSQYFYPDNFYDTRIKSTMPIINPELKINRNIKNQEIVLQKNEIDIYKRELVKEIKVAYYNYSMATESIRIYENALTLVNQNLKVNQSLLANGKGLPVYVKRALFEVQSVEGQIQVAHNEQQNAIAYFNFLLNKPLTDSIVFSPDNIEDSVSTYIPVDNINNSGREELANMAISQEINRNLLQLNRSFRTPKLNGFIDLGAQNFDFKVNNRSFFYLAGLQLQVPLYSGKKNIYKIQQAEQDSKNISLQKRQVENQLKLATSVSKNNLRSALSNYHVSINQLESAQSFFHLIDLGYREGVNSFIELLDARTQLTNIQLQININKYKFLSVLADYERQTASYSLNK